MSPIVRLTKKESRKRRRLSTGRSLSMGGGGDQSSDDVDNDDDDRSDDDARTIHLTGSRPLVVVDNIVREFVRTQRFSVVKKYDAVNAEKFDRLHREIRDLAVQKDWETDDNRKLRLEIQRKVANVRTRMCKAGLIVKDSATGEFMLAEESGGHLRGSKDLVGSDMLVMSRQVQRNNVLLLVLYLVYLT
ncbi:MAG: hypothetical protein M1840_001939 [Geoglossum simile]|nr:MAG: hypothetical protein M1840_001939 [Geoglossum simile]